MLTFEDTIFHQFYVISLFGDNEIVFFLLGIAFSFLLYIKKRYTSAFILILSFSSYLYSLALKHIFRQQRPPTALVEEMRVFDLYSFPSSHVVVYTVFWGFLMYLCLKYLNDYKIFYRVTIWLCVYFLVFVGASRLGLGMHHLKDVVAGYSFGLIYLLLLVLADKRADKFVSEYKKKDNKVRNRSYKHKSG